MPPSVLAVLVVLGTAIVASTNFIQPLTPLVSETFGLRRADAGWLGAIVQFGYAIGVAAFVPLGDLLDRRLLTLVLVLSCAACLAMIGFSPSVGAFAGASFAAGAAAAAIYVIVPFVASLAPDAARGRMIGRVMIGLQLAVPAAWIGAGLVGEAFGWRSVYVANAALVLLCALILLFSLPEDPRPTRSLRQWGGLLASLPAILASTPVLRKRSADCFLNVAGLLMLWSGLPVLLAAPGFDLDAARLSLFGFAALPAAIVAPIVGRLADRGGRDRLGLALPLLTCLAWGVLALAVSKLPTLFIGLSATTALLMALQVLNQIQVSSLAADHRSSYTAIYAASGLLGAAAGAAIAPILLVLFGWSGLCLAGLACSAVILARRLRERKHVPIS